MANDFTLGVGQAHEVEMAMNRVGGWNGELVKALSTGTKLADVREVLLGYAEIKPIEHLIDFDAVPFIPGGWTILPDADQLPNRVRGKVKFDQTKITLHLDDGQKSGKVIEGNKLRKKLEKEPVHGAQLLDFYLANPHLIPEEWKGKAVFFWGTIYRDSDGSLVVRSLCWGGGRWGWGCFWLGDYFRGGSPAALSASI